MTPDSLIVLLILAVAVVLFITEWLRVDVVAFGVVVALMASGVLTVEEAISGFASTTVLAIAALFIVGGGVLQTGLAGQIGRRILSVAGEGEGRLLVVLTGAVALLSGFMSNTGTVAVLLPAVLMLARSVKVAPSKLLIPLSFGSMLGGSATLIGTPPNIIVSDALRDAGYAPFAFFSFAPVGLLLTVLGIVYLLYVGRRLLPAGAPPDAAQQEESPHELVALYDLPETLYRLRVRRQSPLVGKSLARARLRRDFHIQVLDIQRRAEPRPLPRLVSRGENGNGGAPRVTIPVEADTVVELDDYLVVQGDEQDVRRAAAAWNLGVRSTDAAGLVNEEIGVAEVILTPRSRLIGKTLPEANFGEQYSLTVLGVSRQGQRLTDVERLRLAFGDTLLVQGKWESMRALRRDRRNIILVGQPEALIGAAHPGRGGAALLILLGMLLLIVTNTMSVTMATMAAALAMVLAGCLTMDEAYGAIDWKSVVLIAGMLPMSIALQRVGLVDLAADALVNTLGELAPRAVLAGLFLLTAVFTQVLSNTATTVILAPVALATAATLGVAPQAFMMGVAVAASMAFASPVASPTNTLVMGAGGYRFRDYAKVGVPLIFICLLVSVLVLPLLWPFY